MRSPDDDTLLGLEQAKKGRKPRRGSGSLPQRIRASKRLPQAVFKISSYSRSGGAVWDRVHYISREGELAVEDANGAQLADLAALEEMVGEWEERQGKRATRLAMSAVVSFPASVDQEKATAAVRQFFQAAFADTSDYVFAPHADTDQFHVHLLLETRGHDGQQLRLDRAVLHDLRLLLAEQARAQGIELDASPRWARGVEWEQQRPRAVEGIERRGGGRRLGSRRNHVRGPRRPARKRPPPRWPPSRPRTRTAQNTSPRAKPWSTPEPQPR